MNGTLAINLVALTVFTVSLSIGQLLFKHVGLGMRSKPVAEGFADMLREPSLYAALTLYGFATLLWIWILSRVPLSIAYPWVAAGVVIVPLLSWWVYGEKINLTFWFGAGLVVVGILITQRGLSDA
jgi:multidrug transporter EmrE-like cation transporter